MNKLRNVRYLSLEDAEDPILGFLDKDENILLETSNKLKKWYENWMIMMNNCHMITIKMVFFTLNIWFPTPETLLFVWTASYPKLALPPPLPKSTPSSNQYICSSQSINPLRNLTSELLFLQANSRIQQESTSKPNPLTVLPYHLQNLGFQTNLTLF